jgi:hypothetical protein
MFGAIVAFKNDGDECIEKFEAAVVVFSAILAFILILKSCSLLISS